MKKLMLLLFLITGINSLVSGQEQSKVYEPNGKPLALIFTNYNTSFSDGETTPTFEITRAYLGYEYNFDPKWYAKVVLDVGNPKAGGHEMAAYLKNAYFQYKNNNFTASFGMISTTQFKVSEKIWGYRYIEKSFQDAYKFNSSADLGFNLSYKFANFISVDFSVINGEGYKKIQSDNIVRPGFGTTIKPIENITTRVFVDFMKDDATQQSLATFAAYTSDNLILGAEYNYQQNYDMVDGQDIYGTSFFATYKPSEKVKIFGRYDNLNSKKLTGETETWNVDNDGQLIMAGIEFSPVKGVKLAPNFRLWNPANQSTPNTTSLFLNCELKF